MSGRAKLEHGTPVRGGRKVRLVEWYGEAWVRRA